MTQKLLISTDRNGIAEFQKAVTATAEAANSLISIFNEFQSYEVITAEALFLTLLADPGSYFDEVLLRHVKLDTGGRKPDPAVLASLVGLHRDEYLNAVAGLPLTSEDCEPCRKIAKQIPGRKAISKYQFDQYRDYLIFSAGSFSVDQSRVDADLDRFNTYAETPAEVALCEHFTGLVEILNKHDAMYTLPNREKKTIATALHLHLTEAYQGAFMLDIQYLSKEISKLKYQ